MDCPQIDLYEFLTEAELQHYYNAVKDELKITSASQFKYATDEDLKSIGMSRPEIRRLRKFYEKHFPHGYLSKIKRLLHAPTSIVKKDEMSSSITNATASSPSGSLAGNATGTAAKTGSSSPSKAPNNKHIIPADAISVNKQLGTGEFGIVQQGVWTNGSERIQVAIKCLCRERMQSNPMEFLKEAAIMHSIEHENIVRLYGVVLATDSLMLVTELAHLRSLLECLKDPGLRAIIGEEGREAYNSLIERKHTLDIDTTVCLLRKQEPQFPLKSAKTLPRRSTHFKHDSDEFISTIPLRSIGNDNEMVIPPLQNAPRPTTLPTRGAANRLRKVELELSKDTNSTTALNSRMGDNVSPCESPSYVTNTSSFKFPEKPSSPADSETATHDNALPVLPPKEGKKHIQANPKRHVRKYPLIIPANGVQRTLQRVINDEEKSPSLLKSPTAANTTSRNLPTVKPFNINNSNNMAEYENTTKIQSSSTTTNSQDRTYQNIGTDDTASLQFESILEADFNKDQVLQSPDVTDGFYNFSIQKDHYHKSKEVDFDAQKLASGLYVNEDELRNLDIEKNIVKLNKQNPDNSLKKSNESLDVKSTTVTEENTKHTTMTASSPSSSAKQIEITEESFDKSPALAATQPSSDKQLKSSVKLLKADNELAGNALFKKVRESVDKAMIKPPNKLAVDTGVIAKRELNKTPAPPTEAEMFSAAINRLNDSNSVSCEDLLEFADKKPKGHERGVDSDEVRIMMKVLGKDSSPERCLTALGFIDWDVHKAIKIIKLQNILNDMNLTLPETVEYLLKYDWDLHTTARRLKCSKT